MVCACPTCSVRKHVRFARIKHAALVFQKTIFEGRNSGLKRNARRTSQILGSVLGRMDFSQIFIFGPRDFFADFETDSSPHFCGNKCPEKSSRNIPGKLLQICTTKILDTFLQRGRPNRFTSVVVSTQMVILSANRGCHALAQAQELLH